MKRHAVNLGSIVLSVEAKTRFEAEELVAGALTELVQQYALENGNNRCKHCDRFCGGRRVCDICA